MCEGYKFRGGGSKRVPQMWFVDDGAFVTTDLATLQLVLDTCWMVTRAAGLKIMIKKDTKTAWQASYWANGVEYEVKDWVMRLPDGREVPRVGKEYTYLGSTDPTRPGHGVYTDMRVVTPERCLTPPLARGMRAHAAWRSARM